MDRNETIEIDEEQLVVKDADGNLLVDGDDVILVKDSKLKGSSRKLKKGTKYKSIRLLKAIIMLIVARFC